MRRELGLKNMKKRRALLGVVLVAWLCALLGRHPRGLSGVLPSLHDVAPVKTCGCPLSAPCGDCCGPEHCPCGPTR